jgi:hypothetical protein
LVEVEVSDDDYGGRKGVNGVIVVFVTMKVR